MDRTSSLEPRAQIDNEMRAADERFSDDEDAAEEARITGAEQNLLAENYRLIRELEERVQWIEDRVCPSRRPSSFMMRTQPALDDAELTECLETMKREKDQNIPLQHPFLAWRWRELNLGMEREARAIINRVSRPYVNATIMDLPNELLIKIIAEADVEPVSGQPAVGHIQRCRLVCRRLCRTANEFLVPEVSVSTESRSSLARLEAISQHPEISHCVKTVRFDFYQYNDSVSSSPKVFLHCFVERLHKLGPPHYEAAVDTLLSLGNEYVLEPVTTQHDAYRRLQREQNAFFNDGFFERVAAAVARMPSARTLRFFDLGFEHERAHFRIRRRFIAETADARLRQSLTSASWHYNASESAPISRVNPYMTQMAACLGQANVRPRSISMEFESEMTWFLPISPEQHQHILPWVEELESLHVAAKRRANDASFKNFNSREKLCTSVLGAPRLRTVSINVEERPPNFSGPHFSRRPLFWGRSLAALSSRDHLMDITVRGLRLHQRHLVAFLGTPRRMKRLQLDEVQLATGSWRSVLDVLREFQCPSKVLRRPWGAEMVSGRVEEVNRILGDNSDGPSVAEQYIRGDDMQNPFDAPGWEGLYEGLRRRDEALLRSLAEME